MKSPISNQLFKYADFKDELQFKINNLSISEQGKSKAKRAYNSINHDIEFGNNDSIHNHFDIAYISRFEASRMVAGFVNHGFTPENLFFALDTTSYKFYPILHRDNYFSVLDLENRNDWIPYYYKGVGKFHFEVLKLLSENKIINTYKNDLLKHTLKERDKIQIQYDSIDNHHYNITNANFNTYLYDTNEIMNNFNEIEKYLYEKMDLCINL